MSNINIRDGVFETNSSSAHTVVLRNKTDYSTKDDFKDAIDLAKDIQSHINKNKLYFPIPSFSDSYHCYGRSFELLKEWEDKFFYMVASYPDFDKLSIIMDVVTARIPELDGIVTELSEYAFAGVTTNEFPLPIYEAYDCTGESFGSVDSQSYDNMDVMMSALKKTPEYENKTFAEIVDEVIFSNKFIIVCDSDETNTFEELFSSGYFESTGFTHILRGKYRDEKSDTDFSMVYDFVTIEDYFDDIKEEE